MENKTYENSQKARETFGKRKAKGVSFI